jgi:hypothetical protein
LLEGINGEIEILVAGKATHHENRWRRGDATGVADSRIKTTQIDPNATHRGELNGTGSGPSVVEGGVLGVKSHCVGGQPGESSLNRRIDHGTAAVGSEEAAVNDRDARDTELPAGESAKNERRRCVQVKQGGPLPPYHIRQR